MGFAPVVAKGPDSRGGSGAPGSPVRSLLSVGHISISAGTPRSDTTGSSIAFAPAPTPVFSREDPTEQDCRGCDCAPVQGSDAVTESSSQQGSQPCGSTAQLEMKSNLRLQDTY